MSYREKYLKYKEKYFNLKGGFLNRILQKKHGQLKPGYEQAIREQEQERPMAIERERPMAIERERPMAIEREQERPMTIEPEQAKVIKRDFSKGLGFNQRLSNGQGIYEKEQRKPSERALEIARRKIGERVILNPGHKIIIIRNGIIVKKIELQNECKVLYISINESLSNQETIMYGIRILTSVPELEPYVSHEYEYAYAFTQQSPSPPPPPQKSYESADSSHTQPNQLKRLVLTDDGILLLHVNSIYEGIPQTVSEIKVADYDSLNMTKDSIYVDKSTKLIRICDIKKIFENYAEYQSFLRCKEKSYMSSSNKKHERYAKNL